MHNINRALSFKVMKAGGIKNKNWPQIKKKKKTMKEVVFTQNKKNKWEKMKREKETR